MFDKNYMNKITKTKNLLHICNLNKMAKFIAYLNFNKRVDCCLNLIDVLSSKEQANVAINKESKQVIFQTI